MKKTGLLAATLFLFFSIIAQAQTGNLSVTINQTEPNKGGIVKIGIFDSQGFPEVGQEVVGVNLKVTAPSVSHVFTDIPVGTYAISVFQDVNQNAAIDKNFFGAPNEPYGFSTNNYGMFGPPDFKDVSFDIKKNTSISLTIDLE